MARPKRVFTDDEKALIEHYALNGGKNHTIATALGMPVNTLTNRFTRLLQKNRALRKLKLAENQTKQAETSADMAKFLGVNELGQEIKQTIKDETKDLKPMSKEELELFEEVAAEVMRRKSIRLHKASEEPQEAAG